MKDEKIKNKVVVFGGSHHNTLGVVRGLGEKGIKPYVFISNKNNLDSLVLKSKYVEAGWIYKSDIDCLNKIIEKFTDNNNKTIIISTADSITSCLDLNFDKLKVDFIIPNGGKQGNLTYLMNKETMNDLAKQIGFNVAETWLLSDIITCEEIQYPCITKPIKSIAGSKSDIKICKTPSELRQFISSRDCGDRIQVQKYIERDFEYQLIGCSLNGGGEVIIPGFTKIIRAANDTNTGLLRYLPISELEFDLDSCKKFIRACNYSGLFSLEFIRGKDGIDYFLEINFRNDGNAYSVTAAGVNLPYIWVKGSLNMDYEHEANQKIMPTLVMPELVDILQLFAGKVTLKKWLKDVKDTDCFIYYNKKDKKPFYYELKQMIIIKLQLYLRRMLKQTH